MPSMGHIASVRPIIGLEVHVELATTTKVFAAAPNPAAASSAPNSNDDAPPNTLLDPVVLALPGSLPVVNRAAVEQSIRVGLALGCSIAEVTRWDRKGYAYPDLPKGYQISQYQLPLCFDGRVELPAIDDHGEPDWSARGTAIGVIRAHLEEDAGKLLHEAPGGGPLQRPGCGSIVDLNRAGAPLLEIVTQPDFDSADQVVVFCRLLRHTCRFIGATDGVMQRGHIRFEPNINCELRLRDGGVVRTPIVEVKNLNSFRAVRGAIEHEIERQPAQWAETGAVHAPGTKTTRGWDDTRGVTTPQREKEDALDYRYFPDPDIPPLDISAAWRDELRASLPELPAERLRRSVAIDRLAPADAIAFVEEPRDAALFDAATDAAQRGGLDRPAAARQVCNIFLQHGARIANERGCALADLGVDAKQIATIAMMRAAGDIEAENAGRLVEKLADPDYADRDATAVAEYEGWLVVRDTGLLERWCDEVILDHADIADQIRAGKQQAVGRLIGEVKKKSGGSADAKIVRDMLLARLR